MRALDLSEVHLDEKDWKWASERLPIACVDLLPVQRDAAGRVARIGLIRRDSPMGPRWCHLGGRVLYGETLAEALRRHLTGSLSGTEGAEIATNPYFVNQYFPNHDHPDAGFDPRKHAVAVCHLVEFSPGARPAAHGSEALSFAWFSVDALPQDSELWPGSKLMIDRREIVGEPIDEIVSYEAINQRYLSHNELMWQTPVLAMTAMAFLLTIALGDGDQWMRALAAGLSTLIAMISAQLMAKHSDSQIQDAELLYQIERRRGMLPLHQRPEPVKAPFSVRLNGLSAWFATKRSRSWWFAGLLLMAIVSAGIAVHAVSKMIAQTL